MNRKPIVGITPHYEEAKKEFIMGLQFHPELLLKNNNVFLGIFTEFIVQADRFRRKHPKL